MAMNKNLEVGSILFPYQLCNYIEREHRTGRPHYTLYFKLLYVQNRRERSSGANVPKAMEPTLNKLGIRTIDHGGDSIAAIGCRGYTYFSIRHTSPYPTPDIIAKAQATLKEQLESATASNEGVRLMENDFIKDFREKKVSNRESIFSLQKPLHEYLANETHIG